MFRRLQREKKRKKKGGGGDPILNELLTRSIHLSMGITETAGVVSDGHIASPRSYVTNIPLNRRKPTTYGKLLN